MTMRDRVRRSFFLGLFLLVACENDHVPFSVRESIEQLQITHARPGADVIVFDPAEHEVARGVIDTLGSFMARKLAPGDGYHVVSDGARSHSLSVRALAGSTPAASFYAAQQLVAGTQYITTRDGTTLSAYITLPGPIGAGPYPTVVNYSGYSASKPGAPVGDYAFLCDSLPILCDAPSDPSALIAGLLGYATVSVNLRGTGCSGGAYDYFEPLQLTDGYDVIETVAAQPWVAYHAVGMVGLSYPGITQLFIAAQRPPSLAAITPLSVIGNTWTTLVPGGILNDGFALAWVNGVLSKADPYGQGWEQDRVDAGDTICRENQLLHAQKIDNVEEARKVIAYDPAQHDHYNPMTFVGQIEVPVFLTGAFQDEQTGPFFATLLDRFTAAPERRFTIFNGVHPDGFSPQTLAEWAGFLDLYVARRVPRIDPLVKTLAPVLFKTIFQTELELPDSKYASHATLDEARAAFHADPILRAIFERGADPAHPGAPVGDWELTRSAWPPPDTQSLRLFMHGDGTLGTIASTEANRASQFRLDPDAGARGILAPGGDVWAPAPAYDWRQPAAGDAVVFESAAFTEDQVMLGMASADLWIKSPVDDADLEVNLSEVRPDGNEVYVQSGWLRASFRALAPDATERWPDQTFYAKDMAPLVPAAWTPVRIALAPLGHAFRVGSRLRVSIDTPGDSRAEWRFALKKFPMSDVRYAIGHDAAHPSSIVLPLLPGVPAPTPLPACGTLRGQQCRPWVAYTNAPAP